MQLGPKIMQKGEKMKKNVITNWEDLPVLISVEILSHIYNCTPATITRWTREGRLRSVQINRRHMYDKDYIQHLLTNREIEYER